VPFRFVTIFPYRSNFFLPKPINLTTGKGGDTEGSEEEEAGGIAVAGARGFRTGRL
jgi:hypothetical protein